MNLIQLFGIIGTIGSSIFAGVTCGKYFGWFGAINGTILGCIFGYTLFVYLPFRLNHNWITSQLNEFERDDVTKLKQRLETEYFLSHFIIGELITRGEPLEQFQDYVFSQLHSDSSARRLCGWNNLNIWFPELAAQVGSFDAENPTAKSKIKLLEMQTLKEDSSAGAEKHLDS